MSLKHIENRRDPTVFGDDLNVLIGDVIINGNLDVQGLINGNSDQGQNENNVWTGTNDWSIFRPQTTPTTGVGFSGVNLSLEQSKIVADSIINQGATWSGANTFANNITSTVLTPVNPTDAVPCAYVKSRASLQNGSYLASNNTWTGVNTFDFLPVCIAPVANAEIATKGYTDTALATFVQGGTTTERRQTDLVPTVFTDVAFCASVIGGGGGSTYGNGVTAGGYAGGAGALSSLLVLTQAIGGVSKGTFSISVGVGGTPGIGITPPASYSGSGGTTILSVTPVPGQGLNPATVQILTAGGGGGNILCNGAVGNPSFAGVYENSPNVQSPWGSSNGNIGTLFGGTAKFIPGIDGSPSVLSPGIEDFGWGASALVAGDGKQGNRGGFGITNYLG